MTSYESKVLAAVRAARRKDQMFALEVQRHPGAAVPITVEFLKGNSNAEDER